MANPFVDISGNDLAVGDFVITIDCMASYHGLTFGRVTGFYEREDDLNAFVWGNVNDTRPYVPPPPKYVTYLKLETIQDNVLRNETTESSRRVMRIQKNQIPEDKLKVFETSEYFNVKQITNRLDEIE